MDEWLKALILGILQGLTEYLPVSSSGHIELGQALLGYQIEDEMTFSVMLHVATVLSTIVIMWKDIWQIFKGLFQFAWNEECAFAVKVIISMIPAAIVGVLLDDYLDALFAGQIFLVGAMLWLTALLLWLASRAQNTNQDVTYTNAFLVGLAQMVAILPGLSRSGATISTSVLLKIDKAKAARFSFLMVVPLILGKAAKDILSGDLATEKLFQAPMVAGFLAAFVVGCLACSLMLNLVKKGKLAYFSIYCLVVGAIAMVAGFL